MYWLTRDSCGRPVLLAYLPHDEVWEGGMPGRWLERQSLDTFGRSAGGEAEPLSLPSAATVGELRDVAGGVGTQVVVLSLTRRAYFPPLWWRPLVAALGEGEEVVLALPMGPSFPPSQGLPVGYWTPSDLCEVGRAVSGERREVRGECSPWIGAFEVERLGHIDQGLPLSDVLKALAQKGIVMAAGGLVHYFADFYSSPREDMFSLVPAPPKRVLDVGCAKGEFGRLLKERWGCEVWGIELVEESARVARNVLDRVEVMDVEEGSPRWNGMFDLVVLGDILEHLRDPWGFLGKVRSWVAAGGTVITSVPNTGFYPVVRALLQGRFDYVPVGLLCVEHLRFFTRETLREMFEEAGFAVVRMEPQPAALPTPYLKELEELTRLIPSLDRDSLSAPGYYIVATPRE